MQSSRSIEQSVCEKNKNKQTETQTDTHTQTHKRPLPAEGAVEKNKRFWAGYFGESRLLDQRKAWPSMTRSAIEAPNDSNCTTI